MINCVVYVTLDIGNGVIGNKLIVAVTIMAARLGSFILTLTLGSLLCQVTSGDEKDPNDEKTRYILYDVNPGEGFNLRRDVYMRMAVWVRSLNLQTGTRWVLVLPPWSHLYHWQNRVLYQVELQTFLRRSLRHLLRPSPGCKRLISYLRHKEDTMLLLGC